MRHRSIVRADFVCVVTEVLLNRGLPYEIIHLILGLRDYAANVIRRAAMDLPSDSRNVRMAIRWFVMDTGAPDPFIARSHGWHWVHPADANMSALDELIIHTRWQIAGCPVPPYRVHDMLRRDFVCARCRPSAFCSVLSRSAPALLTPGMIVLLLVE